MDNQTMYNAPFEPGQFYHVYNHAVGSERLFSETENYHYFLKKYDYYLDEVLVTYAYCLLPNHFHLLIKTSEDTSAQRVSEQFRKFLISYSKSYNKRFSRRGNLFERHLKRVSIESDEQLIWIIFYLHRNPVHHGLTKNFRTFAWSSYRSLISDKNTRLPREEIIHLFSGKDKFEKFHEKNVIEYGNIHGLVLE